MQDDSSDDTNNSNNPNIEWNKNMPLPKQRPSRRIDAQLSDEKQPFAVEGAFRPAANKTNPNLVRKKIKDVYDDDDDEDENAYFQVIPTINFEEELVINPKEEEKTEQSKAKREAFIQKGISLEKSAGKLNAVNTANLLAKETGLKKVNARTEADTMNSVSDNPQELVQKAVNKDLVTQTKLKPRSNHKLQPNQLKDFFAGVKRIEIVGGSKAAVKGLKLEEVVEAGKKQTEDKHIAKVILQKTGRKVDKKKLAKVKSTQSAQKEFNKLATKASNLKDISC